MPAGTQVREDVWKETEGGSLMLRSSSFWSWSPSQIGLLWAAIPDDPIWRGALSVTGAGDKPEEKVLTFMLSVCELPRSRCWKKDARLYGHLG